MRKDRMIKKLEVRKRLFYKNNEFQKAHEVGKLIAQIKDQGVIQTIQDIYGPQKKLFFCKPADLYKLLILKTYTRRCSSCQRIFQSPHKRWKTKCILCKIEQGHLHQARRDLELYSVSDLAEQHQENISKILKHDNRN